MLLARISLFLITAVLSGVFYIMFCADSRKLKQRLNDVESEHDKLFKKNTELTKTNNALKDKLEKTVALYDITKVICRSLEEEKVFSLFKEELNRYIKVDDCRFIKSHEELSKYGDYTVIPLALQRDSLGFLVAHVSSRQEKDKFNILAQQFVLGMKRAILYQKVQESAIVDSLTGVYSRRYWAERFQQEVIRSEKFKYNFSFLMVDIDNFKMLNDNYGHLVGDAILKEASRRIRQNLRQVDLIGRFGGEEFCIILTETDRNGAKFAAERIRQAVESKNIRVYDEDLKVTISIGVAVFPDDARDSNSIFEKADNALYQAKQAGKNRVCFYEKN